MTSTNQANIATWVDDVRNYLATKMTIIDVALEDLDIVYYEDPSLKKINDGVEPRRRNREDNLPAVERRLSPTRVEVEKNYACRNQRVDDSSRLSEKMVTTDKRCNHNANAGDGN